MSTTPQQHIQNDKVSADPLATHGSTDEAHRVDPGAHGHTLIQNGARTDGPPGGLATLPGGGSASAASAPLTSHSAASRGWRSSRGGYSSRISKTSSTSTTTRMELESKRQRIIELERIVAMKPHSSASTRTSRPSIAPSGATASTQYSRARGNPDADRMAQFENHRRTSGQTLPLRAEASRLLACKRFTAHLKTVTLNNKCLRLLLGNDFRL